MTEPPLATIWAADPHFVARVPHRYARQALVLGARPRGERAAPREDDSPCVLLASEHVPELVRHNLSARLGMPQLPIVIADEASLASLIDDSYGWASAATDSTADPSPPHPHHPCTGHHDVAATEHYCVLTTQGKGDLSRTLDELLFHAIRRGASDVHLQPLHDAVLVRYRVDGVLHTVKRIPRADAPGLISRLKVLARLDVAEHRAAQDGRTRVHAASDDPGVDLRVSIVPTTYGERAVVRVLDTQRGAQLLSLASLGMPADVLDAYMREAGRSSGMLLVTGPTGSGKTTTLYSTLRWLGRPTPNGTDASASHRNMLTIEDPVEYDLAATGLIVSQTAVDVKKGVSFASGLRHMLRQDPDVIMVGEVRDEDTARIAVQASLTGHLVLTTMHTVDAASAVARLDDLGVERFLIASCVNAVLAQRLVRTVHGPCGGAGCDACFHSGFRGRCGVYELLTLSTRLRELIASPACTSHALRAAAVRGAGMRTLAGHGELLVASGRTTHAELCRVLSADDEPLAPRDSCLALADAPPSGALQP